MREAVLAVLCSGRGSNLQSIIRAVEDGRIRARIGLVLTDKPEAKACLLYTSVLKKALPESRFCSTLKADE